MFNFGENLKNLRKAKKLSQKQLGDRVGVSESIVSRYESGEVSPPIDTLCKMAKELNVSLDEFCGIQTPGTTSLFGLKEEQTEVVKSLISVLKNKNTLVKKNLSSEQYELIGRIVAELTK